MKQDIYKNTEVLVIDALIERFKQTFEDTGKLDINQLDRLYAKDVHFKDPIHDIQGVDSKKNYMEKLCKNIDSCRFVYLDQVQEKGKAYIKWDMYFSHPSLKKGEHKVRGISQINYDTRIFYQEDVYDMGSMIYEKVPVLGSVVSFLKNRLAK